MLSGFFVTKKGKNLLAKTHDGANIELTRAEIGSGDIPEGQLVTEVTSLYGKVKELPLGEVKVGSGKEVCIPVQLTNKGVLTSFLFKEIGVYAIDPESHPTWVRGLKYLHISGLDGIAVSHPTWVRGLKSSC